MRLRTNPSEISLADLSHRLNRLLQTQFRFSSELDMRSKKDPSEREDRSQHPPSSDCFHGKMARLFLDVLQIQPIFLPLEDRDAFPLAS